MRAAAQLLGRSERQVWRLLKAFRGDGVAGLISKKRGRPSNRRIASGGACGGDCEIVRQNYADFGPTLAAEKLAEEHGFAVSSETLRQWMIEDGLWRDRKQRKQRSPAAAAARMRRRTGAGRRQRALVVRGSRAAMHPAGVCRRRDQPADASAICRERVDLSPIFTRPAPIWRPGASRSRFTATSTGCSGSTIRVRLAVTG